MVNANPTTWAELSPANASRVRFTLEMTEMLGRWRKLHAGCWDDEREAICGGGLPLAFKTVADVQGLGFRGDGVGDFAALATAGEVGFFGGSHECAGPKF